jgi:hypothetical protein
LIKFLELTDNDQRDILLARLLLVLLDLGDQLLLLERRDRLLAVLLSLAAEELLIDAVLEPEGRHVRRRGGERRARDPAGRAGDRPGL